MIWPPAFRLLQVTSMTRPPASSKKSMLPAPPTKLTVVFADEKESKPWAACQPEAVGTVMRRRPPLLKALLPAV